MSSIEQVKAPGYPESVSQIKFDMMECGYINSAFDGAVRDHGNGDQFTWESYADGDYEIFTVRNYGKSDAPLNETNYYQMSKWILDFRVRKKTLLLDLGRNKIERYDGEFTVAASALDVSDIVAAIKNYDAYLNDRRDQGWDPYLDHLLREKGLM